MSVIKQTRKWNGVTVEQRVNTDTGQMEIYLPAGVSTIGALKLAETYQDGTSNKWRLNNKNQYKTFVNNSLKAKGLDPLTDKTFDEAFFLNGAPTFNNDRAAVLNNNNNYATQAVARNKREGFFNNNIPLVVDPKTGAQVNSQGVQTSRQVTGQQQQTNDDGDGDGNNQSVLSAQSEDDRRGGPKGKGTGIKSEPGKILRYPLDEPSGPFKYDYISITAHDYVPSGLGNLIRKKGEKYAAVDKNLGPAYERVIFPMQPQLSETNAVNWSDDQLNPVQGAAAGLAASLINSEDFKQAGAAIVEGFENLKAMASDKQLSSFAAAYFAGQAVGANVVGRSTGMVINPNLELLFNGPNLRTFNFNFRLTPRFKEESEVIREIIFAFKRNMAVQRSSSNLFLRSPRLFQLKYVYEEGDQHPYLNKFKPCAMTNFQVNYTPDGSYATYEGTGSLTAYDLTMSFSEVMPIYAGDNEYTENPTDMGY